VVVPPIHDGPEGQNVLRSWRCHRVTPENDGRADFPSTRRPSPPPAVLTAASQRQDISCAVRAISRITCRVQETGGTLMATLSRRTSDAARLQFRTWLAPHCAVFYEGDGPNPYFAMLGAADHVFVTADSVNMATEAAATAKPVHVLDVDGSGGKLVRPSEPARRVVRGASMDGGDGPTRPAGRTGSPRLSSRAARAAASRVSARPVNRHIEPTGTVKAKT
jgi:mitochondrial fission protein ELM1